MTQVAPTHVHIHSPPRTNTLAMIGFILTLIGLIGLCLPPLLLLGVLGGVLCFFGMFRPPRALAILGLILALLEACILAAYILLLGGMIFAFGSILSYGQAALHIAGIGEQVEQYRADHNVLPQSLDVLSGIERTDPWGNPYQYEILIDEGDYRIGTWGRDGLPNTADDFFLEGSVFGSFGGAWPGEFEIDDLEIDPDSLLRPGGNN